ncbi:methyltransferase domain-containing protein [Boudabousia marimammalium]|uniref:Methyltransferase domain-containing protein n=1 Tax=Boudabousia marimammalium TaxID=156892 RepID=A0A1Q5PLW2_9ACTO|nr:methyltransferase domain-containing protein [Boudabousia marimammalium]OKL48055.1 hypothetical protein BM477_06190 [Boudabousia marimammalium]
MECSYFDAGECRSCQWLDQPYPQQVARLEQECHALLPQIPASAWLSTMTGPEQGFRNKAKMVVSGSATAPTLGILDENWQGVDLSACPLYSDSLRALFPVIANFLATLKIPPYEVESRNGEIKFIHVTENARGQHMLRFVLRSRRFVAAIRSSLPALQALLPSLRVVSVNLLPQPVALTEGDTEIILTADDVLPMPMGERVLYARPGGFFQTNTMVATELYRQAQAWAEEVAPATVLDLFCGVGGFGLFLAKPGRRVHGIDISEEAIAAAKLAVLPEDGEVTFAAGDAPSLADEGAAALGGVPDLVVVNPPRRGITAEGCAWLEAKQPGTVIYSSCNPKSLAKDLEMLPNYRVKQIRIFDMFPHTSHVEVLAWLTRADTE